MMVMIIILMVAALATLMLVVVTKPKHFRLQRSATIKAAPEAVHAHLQDFHRWSFWSPWEQLDPDLKRSFSGAETGLGAVYDWAGTKAGTGRMEIIEADVAKRLIISLNFIKPMKANNTAEFTLQKTGEDTVVTWAMFGPSPFMSRLMSTFLNIDDLIGRDFERGLHNLKTISEKS
ncbi:MAG: SRPBCC family protein [Asticcacaulis sp.]